MSKAGVITSGRRKAAILLFNGFGESLYNVSREQFKMNLPILALLLLTADAQPDSQWREEYAESFDQQPAGEKTGSQQLPQWEAGSAAGVVFDGKTKIAGKFLVARSAWTSFNQGPIFNLKLSAAPHDRVRVKFDLYTFGDWRGLQKATGGPQHRLMLFDTAANPRFSFDTNFSTNKVFAQSWPDRNPKANAAMQGGTATEVDSTGRFKNAVRWPIELEYPSDAPALRFAILCGAAAGSGKPMPHFGIDNVVVSVRSTAPTIDPVDRAEDMRAAKAVPLAESGSLIEFDAPAAGRTSLAIFDRSSGRLIRTLLSGEALPAGRNEIRWDGLDNQARPVPAGAYQWRVLSAPGFTARYISTIGVNPPGGEQPEPRRSWVGDHVGAGIVDVDESGVYVGSPMTEGMMMLAKIGARESRVVWTREQFYQSGRLTRAATSGSHVFMLHPNGKLRRLNSQTGRVEAEWQIAKQGEAPVDVDAMGENLAVADQLANRIKWLSVESGKELASVELPSPACVAAIDSNARGGFAAAAGKDIFIIHPDREPRRVASLSGEINAMDYDPMRKELWAVAGGHQVVRLNERFEVAQTYSDKPRELGAFDPTRFAGVYDIASDRKGGFYVGEPGRPPRRIAHIARDGSLIDQWFGGMSFYVGGAFDPDDPTRLFGIAPEGFVNVYRIDYAAGKWEIEAAYATGRLGDSMFPNAGAFRAVRRNGELYLYHRVVPAVLRLDPKLRRAVPVAIAGKVLNRGRSFFQFAGAGREGYPGPWVAAAEYYGFKDLAKAPALYSWADANGNGEFDVEEFRFYPDAKRGLSFHNPGDFTPNGDYIGSANLNEPHALVRLPVAAWEGPDKAAPRWDFDKLETAAEIVADSYGYGSPRGVALAPDGSVSVAYQAGIMIRSHGQYEGGGWPEAGMRGARLLAFDAKMRPLFAVGRQSKIASEANTGVLYYPMQTASGPNRSIIVNDQTKQPAQVWSHDGLYVGGFFDHRADDGLHDGFYRIHGDDNQGAALATAKNGKTYWLMPYQGHNRLYEISGWSDWTRASGEVKTPAKTVASADKGTGLTARYYEGARLALETTETPIYYEQFGGERHAGKVAPHYKAIWSGKVRAPTTNQYEFQSLLGAGEQVAVWIDGRIVHAAGFGQADVRESIDLSAGHQHAIRVEYINPEGRAELKLMWRSRTLDPAPIAADFLFPAD